MEIADIREGTVPAHFQERISEITCSLAKCPGVVAVILYGSAARKQMTPLSDLDICVVTQPAVSPDQWEAIMSRTGPALDLVLFSDLPPALQYRVVRDGIILWTCNRKILHRARADALRRYLDLKPFIGRNARRILENPAADP